MSQRRNMEEREILVIALLQLSPRLDVHTDNYFCPVCMNYGKQREDIYHSENCVAVMVKDWFNSPERRPTAKEIIRDGASSKSARERANRINEQHRSI